MTSVRTYLSIFICSIIHSITRTVQNVHAWAGIVRPQVWHWQQSIGDWKQLCCFLPVVTLQLSAKPRNVVGLSVIQEYGLTAVAICLCPLIQVWYTVLDFKFTSTVYNTYLPMGLPLVLEYRRDQRRCGKRSSGLWSAEYLESAEKLDLS